jgi:hypothetical protein
MPRNAFIRQPAVVAAGLLLTATIALGSFSRLAGAEGRDRDHRGDHRDGDRGYYRAPPVVYGTPYYAPPVVYGSPFGLNINIR